MRDSQHNNMTTMMEALPTWAGNNRIKIMDGRLAANECTTAHTYHGPNGHSRNHFVVRGRIINDFMVTPPSTRRITTMLNG